MQNSPINLKAQFKILNITIWSPELEIKYLVISRYSISVTLYNILQIDASNFDIEAQAQIRSNAFFERGIMKNQIKIENISSNNIQIQSCLTIFDSVN